MVTARGRSSGFTLIELTIAIVLLAVGLLALAGALARALHVTSDARSLHAALREVEGVADSLAFQSSADAGGVALPGLTLLWSPEGCGPVSCMRVTATTPADTLSLLTALSAPAGAPR